MFSVASAPLLGEIKGANNLKGVWWAYFLGGTITAIVFMLPESLFLQTATGEGFLQAVSQAGLFGTVPLPVSINFAILTDFATSSYALIILASLAYIAVGYFIVAYDITWVSRIWLATSVDGLVPRALGSTDRRTHAPLIAIILAAIMVAIYIPIEAYIPSGFTIVGNVGIWTSAATPLITAIAAIAFPSTQKNIFKVSPISRYGPLLRVMGVILTALLLIVMVSFVVYPPLEVALGTVGYSLLAAQFIGVLIWYFVFKSYQKRQGVDITLAFKEIPAE
jgi:amino acid transporter